MSIATALPNPCTASLQVVQVGVTTIPNDSVGGVPSTVQDVSGLFGWAIEETTGSAGAKAEIWDGTGTGTGNFLRAVIDLASNGSSSHEALSPIQILNGAIYLHVTSGSIAGEIEWG